MPKDIPKQAISFVLPKTVTDKLDSLSKEWQMTKTAVIRKLIEEASRG